MKTHCLIFLGLSDTFQRETFDAPINDLSADSALKLVDRVRGYKQGFPVVGYIINRRAK